MTVTPSEDDVVQLDDVEVRNPAGQDVDQRPDPDVCTPATR